MPTICNNGIAIPTTDNTELPCDSYISDGCVVHTDAISYLSLPARSTQQEINNNLLLSLMDARTRIQILEGQEGFQDKFLDVDGTYELQDIDNKKFIYVDSSINSPKIAIVSTLPDGFECYIYYRADFNDELTERLVIDYNLTTPPLFTVPSQFPFTGNIGTIQDNIAVNGIVHIIKRNNNLYTANGDLYSYGS